MALILILPAFSGAEPLVIDARKQYDFARHLFDTGQYERSAEEFERFVYFFPDDNRIREAKFNIAHAYLKAGDPATALARFNGLTDAPTLDTTAVDAYFMKVECYLMLNSSDQAIMQMRNLILLSRDQQIIDSAYLRMGWIQIARLDWAGARKSFARVSDEGRQAHNIERIEQALDNTDSIPVKSPPLAGTLSVLPGLGQIYCGRYEDALSAFVVNGGIMWAAYESFDNDLNGLGTMISLVGLGFYLGNIYGAVSSAHKYNRQRKLDFIDQLKRHVRVGAMTGPASSLHAQTSALSLSLHFNF